MKFTTTSILIVDDDRDICELLKLVLEGEGYHVMVAGDGVDAWKRLRDKKRPDLIILDWMMPRMNGEQFLKQVRTSPFGTIPVIVMSGNDAVQDNVIALRKSYHLKKP